MINARSWRPGLRGHAMIGLTPSPGPPSWVVRGRLLARPGKADQRRQGPVCGHDL